ncbi:phage tail protein [Puniceibacterium sediminis]|uniref:Microcystin-dependent protein n=1 Tax=Puniceibacterium sediminis TaxID=1608407 RepID=A0A238WBT0_9RHOB|nr:tail fiber protein [Puniceibacterium sediminis]SNR43948.1 Microcystin-dependent protein [Puniceibacterium sediminis]
MSEPFIAEIRIFAGNFAPRSWAFCDGQLLPVSNNTALFSLIGTTYGGDGRTTTALPNLQGRAPMHPGRGPGLTARRLGEKDGNETALLTEEHIPKHTHTVRATTSAATANMAPGTTTSLSRSSFGDNLYQSDTSGNLVDLAEEAVAAAGGNQSHTNLQPYLTLNFIIALAGIYPSRS